jgi:hypothetical protein
MYDNNAWEDGWQLGRMWKEMIVDFQNTIPDSTL